MSHLRNFLSIFRLSLTTVAGDEVGVGASALDDVAPK